MANPFVGEIRMGGWNFAPAGWALCNGALVSISQNQVLFQLIGTTYGGNGQTNYQLPNLQGRVPVHQGSLTGQNYVLGQQGGSENVTLTTNQLPAHAHAFEVSTAVATTNTPTGNFVAATTQNTYTTGSGNVPMGNAVGSNGGSQPHANVQPFLCVTYIISLFGIFPSQS